MKIGCCIDAPDLAQALRIGYDFVDLNGQELAAMPLPAVKDLAAELGQVPCMGLHATVPARVRLAGPDFSLDAVREYFYTLAERARICGVRYMGIGSPASRNLPQGFPVERADEQLRMALAAASEAYPQGMILLESLNPTETNYINTMAHAARILEGFEPARFGLVLDVYHFTLCGERAENLTEEIIRLVRYAHIADPIERRFPSADTDPALFAFTRSAAWRAGTEALAIEAVTSDLAGDGKAALEILRAAMQ